MSKSKARFYQYRLLNVLLSKDVEELYAKLNLPDSDMDLVDTKYYILDNWDANTNEQIFKIIKERMGIV